MLLIGVNRSPYTRRVAITLAALGVAYGQRCLSGFGNREEVRRHNPLGRIPALVLDDGETLVDSGAIILQGSVEVPGSPDPADVLAALRPIEHDLLPRAVALIASGAVRRDPEHPRRVVVDEAAAARAPG